MFAGPGRVLAAEIVGRLKRIATVYGLYGAAGLLIICAAGYALDALHAWLASMSGAVQAGLLVAAMLLLLAVSAMVVAILVGRRRHAAPDLKVVTLAAMPELGHHKAWIPAVSGMIVGGAAAAIGRRLGHRKSRHEVSGDA
ncbi:hypothetical protein FG93_05242 [Bosea sp. LC85]|nr:hypothetical protein FG93_05242 [Bosea sp. LC85]